MLNKYQNIYFLGIGGVGMSGLAGWCVENKYTVLGYDRNENYFTSKLKEKGVLINHDMCAKKIPNKILDVKKTLVVYTPAVNKDHDLYLFFRDHNFTIIKRSEFLREIASDYNVIAIAGTHGKTTISIMLSHILVSSGYEPNAFFGGISKNYQSNFLIGRSNYMIVEADEFDKSFLQLEPILSIITSIDRDHVDTYNVEKDMLDAYGRFLYNTYHSYKKNNNQDGVPINGFPVVISSKVDEKNAHYLLTVNKELPKIEFNMLSEKDCGFVNLTLPNHMCSHNVYNAILAATLARKIGLSKKQVESAFKTFQGVKRRFEYHSKSEKLILIDDYAHHPNELGALIHSVRTLYSDKDLFLIFQPHLFSRTKDLEKEFCEVLSTVDQLILFDIYAARETPVAGINSQNLLKQINLEYKWYSDFQGVQEILLQASPKLIITAGAGDIYKIIPTIKSVLL